MLLFAFVDVHAIFFVNDNGRLNPCGLSALYQVLRFRQGGKLGFNADMTRLACEDVTLHKLSV
jgi:hypothetical protein